MIKPAGFELSKSKSLNNKKYFSATNNNNNNTNNNNYYDDDDEEDTYYDDDDDDDDGDDDDEFIFDFNDKKKSSSNNNLVNNQSKISLNNEISAANTSKNTTSNGINNNSGSNYGINNNSSTKNESNRSDNETKSINLNLKSIIENESDYCVELKRAIIHSNINRVNELINGDDSSQFNVNCVFNSGWTPLMYAVSCGSYQLTKLFISKGADINYSFDRITPLMCAAACKRVDEELLLEIINTLIENGATVESYDKHCQTPLMFASREGNTRVAKLLIKNGASVHSEDENGWTSICHACQRGHIDTVYELLRNGSYPNITTFEYQSPSDIAQINGYMNIKCLLEKFIETGNVSETELEEIKKKFENNIISKKDDVELEKFFNSLMLPQLIDICVSNKVTFQMLLNFNESDFEKIGIKNNKTVSTILNEINKLHKQNWKPNSIPLKEQTKLNCQEAVAIMANIARHCDFIACTIKYMCQEIKLADEQFFQEYPDSNKCLINEVKETIRTNTLLGEEVKKLSNFLDKRRTDNDQKTIDLIESKQHKGGKFIAQAGYILFGSLTLVGSMLAFKKYLIK